MDVRPIESEADYDWALAQIEPYFDHVPAPGTPEAARFFVLSTLIGAYEDKVWPIEDPDLIDMLGEIMIQRQLAPADLDRITGQADTLDHLVSGYSLTTKQAWQLHQELGIPADVLIRPSALAAG